MIFSTPLSPNKPSDKQKLFKLFAAILLTLSLSQCATKDTDGDKDGESERALYEAAQKSLNSKQYALAIESFRKIELRYPFGRYAEQAQLEMIYAYYKNYELAAASASADRFIRQHPDHPNTDYAYYMKGLSAFNLDKGMLDRFIKDGAHKRDIGSARDSYNDFKELIERFPDSDYTADAQKRLIYLRNLVARHEIVIATYYLQRAAYIAAANRGRFVIENFPGTSATPDALAIMATAYNEMEMPKLAANSLEILKSNYPNYERLQDDGSLKPFTTLYQDNPHWINFITFGLIKTKNKDIKSQPEVDTDKSSSKLQGSSNESKAAFHSAEDYFNSAKGPLTKPPLEPKLSAAYH